MLLLTKWLTVAFSTARSRRARTRFAAASSNAWTEGELTVGAGDARLWRVQARDQQAPEGAGGGGHDRAGNRRAHAPAAHARGRAATMRMTGWRASGELWERKLDVVEQYLREQRENPDRKGADVSATDSTTLRLERTFDAHGGGGVRRVDQPGGAAALVGGEPAWRTPVADVDLRVGGSLPAVDGRPRRRHHATRWAASTARCAARSAWCTAGAGRQRDGRTGHVSTVTVELRRRRASARPWSWSTRICRDARVSRAPQQGWEACLEMLGDADLRRRGAGVLTLHAWRRLDNKTTTNEKEMKHDG